MNALEKSIIAGAGKALKSYTALSNYWLWHAPESFLQTIVALELGSKHRVFIDASGKKVQKEIGQGRGRPRGDRGKRPDISVWMKGSDKVRAIVEIKHAWNFNPVERDAKKIVRLLSAKSGVKTGYLLIYSEAKGRAGLSHEEALRKRFERWAQSIKWQCVGKKFGTAHGEEYAWGFYLLRCP